MYHFCSCVFIISQNTNFSQQHHVCPLKIVDGLYKFNHVCPLKIVDGLYKFNN